MKNVFLAPLNPYIDNAESPFTHFVIVLYSLFNTMCNTSLIVCCCYFGSLTLFFVIVIVIIIISVIIEKTVHMNS